MGISSEGSEGVDNKAVEYMARREYLLNGLEFGATTSTELPLFDIVALAQIRNTKNLEYENIKESIAKQGLLQQIHVAKLSPESFASYLNFTNQLYRLKTELEDYSPHTDGSYYLVVAGHTRLQAMQEISTERLEELKSHGYSGELPTPIAQCIVHDEPTANQIVSIQFNENLHTQPSKERNAMVIVEGYFYGLNNGLWKTKEEFLSSAGRSFSRKVLNEAIHFCNLPPDIREFVFLKQVPYLAGVELGRTLPLKQASILATVFNGKSAEQLNTEESQLFAEGITQWLGEEMAYIQVHGLQGATLKGRYDSQRKYHQQQLDSASDSSMEFDDTQLGMDVMHDPVHAWRLKLRRERYQYLGLIDQIQNGTIDRGARAVELHMQLFGHDEDLAIDPAAAFQKAAERLGSISAQSTLG